MTKFFDSTALYDVDTGVIKRSQYIHDDFLKQNAELRNASANRAGEFHKAASIPVSLHEHWLREGFDCTKAPIKETLKRLRDADLHQFITTNKNL